MCNKQFKDRSGLWRHNKRDSCTVNTPSIIYPEYSQPHANLINELLKDNKELREMLIEQNKQIIDIIKNSENNTNSNN